MSGRSALITGISGQDGSYLAEHLLREGYEVHGLVHRTGLGLAEHLGEHIAVHDGDLRRSESLEAAMRASQPHEIYHLAAVTRPAQSWNDPPGAFDVVAMGTVRLLDAAVRCAPDSRVFVAGSAEVFGSPESSPQTEQSPFMPRNPYGAAKAAAVAAARAYRTGRDLFVAVGLLFNHESPRRPVDFVTRKITWHAAAIARGDTDELHLGDLDARRDWGYAPDYMEGAWRSLQADTPDDYVFATGILHSVRELVDVAFARAGLEPDDHVVVDEAFVRPEATVPLVGDPAKARRDLGWEPRTDFVTMVQAMVDSDLEALAT